MHSFQPDRFSKQLGKSYTLCDSELALLSSDIHGFYPELIDKESRFYSIGELGINSSNFIVNTNGNRYVLKRLDKNCLESHQESCKSALNLYEQGQPVSRIKVNSSSKLVSQSDEYIYSLWGYISGQYFNGSLSELMSAASSIRDFSRALKSLPLKKNHIQIEPGVEETLEIFQLFLSQQNQWSCFLDETTVGFLSNNLTSYKKSFSFLENTLDRFSQPAPVHFDLHPHNILMENNKVTAFLDLDSIVLLPPEVAYGFASFKLYRQSLSLNKKNTCKLTFAEFCQLMLPELRPIDMISGALVEVMRRTCFILKPILSGQVSPWRSVLDIQLLAIHEINLLSEL